ncbi:TrmH family RNA methyltransferase [Candidatus Saccharibacteria bacterium]|nr:MAG: TrmH family RNA methyltransferase [Candidatus Saccharibacteria bacterium]
MRQIIVVAHNMRSTHNVGSLLRTAEGLAVEQVYLTGYTPYPVVAHDERLPHLTAKLDKQISKTALGAEQYVDWHQEADIHTVITHLRGEGYQIIGLEQTPTSMPLQTMQAPDKVALLLGREVEGLEQEVIDLCDVCVEIPMLGQKESYNVVQAAAMALYQLRFH